MAYSITDLEDKAILIAAERPNSPELLMIYILIEILRAVST